MLWHSNCPTPKDNFCLYSFAENYTEDPIMGQEVEGNRHLTTADGTIVIFPPQPIPPRLISAIEASLRGEWQCLASCEHGVMCTNRVPHPHFPLPPLQPNSHQFLCIRCHPPPPRGWRSWRHPPSIDDQRYKRRRTGNHGR